MRETQAKQVHGHLRLGIAEQVQELNGQITEQLLLMVEQQMLFQMLGIILFTADLEQAQTKHQCLLMVLDRPMLLIALTIVQAQRFLMSDAGFQRQTFLQVIYQTYGLLMGRKFMIHRYQR